MGFKDYFKFPLHPVNNFMINTSDGHRALDILVEFKKKDQLDKFLDILNNDNSVVKTKKHEYSYSNGRLNADGKRFINIRGWGMLTGAGSYNLPADEAIKIQDEFAEYIIERLKSCEVDLHVDVKDNGRGVKYFNLTSLHRSKAEFFNICDQCNKDIKDCDSIYIPVLHMSMCEDCGREYLGSHSMYKEDEKYQNKHVEYIENLFNK